MKKNILKWSFLIVAIVLNNFVYAQRNTSNIKKELNLSSFNRFGLAVNGKVYLEKGTQQKVVVEGPQYIIDQLNTEVKDGGWSIGLKNEKEYQGGELVFHITLPEVTGLSIAGQGSIISKNKFTGINELSFSIAGSGDIEFAGDANILKISIAGNGDVNAPDLEAKECKVSIAGSGDCIINVKDELKVSIAGNGAVKYKGSPSIKSSIAGSGSVSSL